MHWPIIKYDTHAERTERERRPDVRFEDRTMITNERHRSNAREVLYV